MFLPSRTHLSQKTQCSLRLPQLADHFLLDVTAFSVCDFVQMLRGSRALRAVMGLMTSVIEGRAACCPGTGQRGREGNSGSQKQEEVRDWYPSCLFSQNADVSAVTVPCMLVYNGVGAMPGFLRVVLYGGFPPTMRYLSAGQLLWPSW